MRKTSAAWAAGFLEGEGTIELYMRYRKSTGMHYPEPRITASNTKRYYLRKLQRLFGGWLGGYSYEPGKGSSHFGTKTCYRWQVSNLMAYETAKLILPYLHGEKKKAAQLIIDYYDHRPPRLRYGRGIFKPDQRRRDYNAAFAKRVALASGH